MFCHFPQNSCCIFTDLSILYSSELGLFHGLAPNIQQAYNYQIYTFLYIYFLQDILLLGKYEVRATWTINPGSSTQMHLFLQPPPAIQGHSVSHHPVQTARCIKGQAIEHALSRLKTCIAW